MSLCDSGGVVWINGLADDFTRNKVRLSLCADHSAVVSSVSKPQRSVEFQAGFSMTNHDPTGFD